MAAKTTQEKTMKYTKLEAIKELSTYDHAFIAPEEVKNFTEPFGISIKPQVVTANRTNKRGQYIEPKGLFVEGKPNNYKVEGFDARDLADLIARHEGVSVPPMFGRGSGLRAACAALIEHLTK